MAKKTRFGLEGYGVRRVGSFAGKSSAPTHPVSKITRLGAEGYGVRRYRTNAFAGKTAASGVTANPKMWHVRGGFGRHSISGSRGYSR